jgi:hypothetical protein
MVFPSQGEKCVPYILFWRVLCLGYFVHLLLSHDCVSEMGLFWLGKNFFKNAVQPRENIRIQGISAKSSANNSARRQGISTIPSSQRSSGCWALGEAGLGCLD